MTPGNKKVVLGCLGALVLATALLVLVVLAVPYLVQSRVFKEAVVDRVAQRIGADIAYTDLRLTLLPRLRFEIRQATVSLPGRLVAHTEALRVAIRPLPLMRGEVHIARLSLESPQVELFLHGSQAPAAAGDDRTDEGDDGGFAEQIRAGLRALIALAGDADLQVNNGRLHLLLDGRVTETWEAVALTYASTPATMAIEITATATPWGRFKADLLIEPNSLDTDGIVQIQGVDLPGLIARTGSTVPTDFPLQLTQGELDLQIHLTAQRLAEMQARLTVTATDLHLRSNNRTTSIRGLSLDAEVAHTPQATQLTLTTLGTSQPPLAIMGSLTRRKDAGGEGDVSQAEPEPLWSCQLTAEQIDIAPLRALALELAEDDVRVRNLFEIVRHGSLSAVSVAASGDSLAEMGALERVAATVTVTHGGVRIPRTDLDLASIRGRLDLNGGTISAAVDQASLMGTRLEGGHFDMDLLSAALPMEAQIAIQTDLAQLPELLAKVVDEEIRAAIDTHLTDLQGEAQGRFRIGGPVDDLAWAVDLDSLAARLPHALLPHPLEIDAASAHFEDQTLTINTLAARLGESVIDRVAGQMEFKQEISVREASAQLDLSLDDLYAWARQTEAFRAALASVTAADGRIQVSDLSYAGPLTDPRAGKIAMTAELQALRLESDRLPAPLEIASGGLSLSGDQVRFKAVAAALADTRLSINGAVKDIFSAKRGLALTATGEIGALVAQWAVEQGRAATLIQIQNPIALPELTLFSNLKNAVRINTRLETKEGPAITADLHLAPDKVLLNGMTLKDARSDATFSFEKRGRQVRSTFAGRLDLRSLDTLLAEPVKRSGWISGDLRVEVPEMAWMDARVNGQLKGKDISLPIPHRDHLLVEALTLASVDNRVTLETAQLRWGETALGLSGWIAPTEEGPRFDLSVEAAYVDLGALLATLRPADAPEPETATEAQPAGGASGNDEADTGDRRRRPEGAVTLAIDHLEYQHYDLQPLEARVEIDGDRTRVTLTETALCNLELPGSLQFDGNRLQLNLKPAAVTSDVGQFLSCLTQRTIEMGGQLYLLADLSADGPPDVVLNRLTGPLSITASEGRIYKADTLAKVLALVNITEIFAGHYPGLTQEGFVYRDVEMSGHFDNGVFVFDTCMLDSPTLQMTCTGQIDLPASQLDIKVLVAPLKTVDRVVKRLPIAGEILGGTLISIPILIDGPLDDPRVRPLAPKAIGEGVLNLMQRAFQLPVKILEPLTAVPVE